MGLAAYEGVLWESYSHLGPMSWLLPIGRKGRRRYMHGQQYCRQCLAQDAQPYFRRRWRLAFNVVCETHGTLLVDACPHCHAPVEFHTGDFGQRLLEFECPITRCGMCGRDFRQWTPSTDRPAPDALINFQGDLNEALLQGCHHRLPGAHTYSHLFFRGVRHLMQLLGSRGRFSRVRDHLLTENSLLNFDLVLANRWQKFEALRVGDRAFLLDMAYQLIQQWPYVFIEACYNARVSSSYVLTYPNHLPFWLESEVAWNLDDRDYSPSAAELAAAKDYLSRLNLPVSKNSIKRLLGVASVTSLIRKSPTRNLRWNPRGPGKTMPS